MEWFNIINSLTTWLMAFASLILSVAAFLLSKRVLILTSRSYVPLLEVNITDNNEVEIKNKDHDLFTIIQAGYLRVDTFGIEDNEKKEYIHIPVVTESRLRNDLPNEKSITLNAQTAHACAYICPVNAETVKFIEDRVYNCKNLNPHWSTYPSFRSVIHYVEILYKNRHQEQKTLILKKKHYHGSGYLQTTIEENEFEKALQNLHISKDLTNEQIWETLANRFRNPFVY